MYCYKSDGKSHLHSKQEKLCKDTSQAKILEVINSIAQNTSMDNLSTRKQVSLCCVLADLFQAMGDFSVPFHVLSNDDISLLLPFKLISQNSVLIMFWHGQCPSDMDNMSDNFLKVNAALSDENCKFTVSRNQSEVNQSCLLLNRKSLGSCF